MNFLTLKREAVVVIRKDIEHDVVSKDAERACIVNVEEWKRGEAAHFCLFVGLNEK